MSTSTVATITQGQCQICNTLGDVIYFQNSQEKVCTDCAYDAFGILKFAVASTGVRAKRASESGT